MSELILAIETSTRQGSAAVWRDGALVDARPVAGQQRHTAGLLPTIEAVLRDAGHSPRELSVFAFSQGPGSFTGLRVAATIGRMLASVTGCRVVAVPTLDVIAENARDMADCRDAVATVVDARRGQVFGGWYQRDGDGEWAAQQSAALCEPAAWLKTLPRPIGVLGPGAGVVAEACDDDGVVVLPESTWQPSAAHVARLAAKRAAVGAFSQPAEILPLYIRPPECEEVYEQRRAAAKAKRGG